ncbi:hypothetical protein HUE56_30230 (plasmid) [Azospirillum oryzae]|uniref:Uncharacterized protein n=1 Tax=Azospirillum oryzae TaxID=286727 RepID=A0A6N1ATT8_9PROT|nr:MULTISPECIES: hypothetical protein [Azospirillum]KAA0585357.1 hypothetical protein FZ938_25545 [Azospirillum oryzae]QCG99371.1 hypothetical protein E6C67_37005 [Azospirillum sp. TSA2s]QKS54779.1 hypothetical protein HUE56_30230 [Azospirillum oryzae]
MLYVFGLAILMVGLPEIGMGGEQWINLFVATIVVNPLFLVVSVSLPRIGSWTRRLLGNTKADNVAGGLVLNWLGNVFTIAAGAVALSIILGIAKIFNV